MIITSRGSGIMNEGSFTASPIRIAGIIVLAGCVLLSACSTHTDTQKGVKEAVRQATPERRTIASVALNKVDSPYQAHMAGPKRFDDSGLTYYAYRQNGHKLPRSREDQLHAGHPIPLEHARPGDLVFFETDTGSGQGQLRVGILLNSQVAVLALPGSKDNPGHVRRVSLKKDYWARRLVGVTRLMPKS